ncbi:MAG: SDR family oxidoreductase [Pseudomonadota bacterium]
MNSILITGSNRGLGLEWARQYGQSGWRVYATCRYPDQADALQQLCQTYPTMSMHRLDVTRAEEIRNVVEQLQGAPIDLLINNAGVYIEKYQQDSLGSIDYEAWRDSFNVNSLGAVRLTEALLENIARSEKRLVVAVTSHMGSIAEIEGPGSYAYRSSKAALNAAMKGISLELAPRAIGILLLHPGWVRTRMGGMDATLSTEQSVKGMRKIIENYSRRMSGQFYRYDGSKIPW